MIRGKPVQLYTYADANLGHNKLNGKSVKAVLHFINGTPFDWFCKFQSVVNTATYGSESTAARTAIDIEQITRPLWTVHRYHNPSYINDT